MVEGGPRPKTQSKAKPKPIQLSFAANLRRLRMERGYTQEQFAERVGFAARYVQRLESGRASVELVTLAAVAKGLRVGYDELLAPAKLTPAKGRPRKSR